MTLGFLTIKTFYRLYDLGIGVTVIEIQAETKTASTIKRHTLS